MSKPITVDRFYYLLGQSMNKSNGRYYIELWQAEDVSLRYFYVFIDSYGDLNAQTDGGASLLKYLYEEKPETPLDELNKVLKDGSIAYMHQLDFVRDWRNKYESQLKELK